MVLQSTRRDVRKTKKGTAGCEVDVLADVGATFFLFAANRSVWFSSCEACLFLESGASAVLSHPDVAVHGRKGLFMMNECKRILNKDVSGEGLWQTDLAKCQGQQEGEVVELRAGDEVGNMSDATERSDAEEIADNPSDDAKELFDPLSEEEAEEDVEMAGLAEQAVVEEVSASTAATAEEQFDDATDVDPMVGASEPTNAKGGAQNHKKPDVHIFQITISVRDDWLHRGDALQDMDLQTYAEYIQRQAKPIRGSELRQTLA